MNVRVTFEDGTTKVIELREATFGVEGTAAHGPVKHVTPIRVDRSPDGAFPHHTRLSRSATR